MSSLGPLARLVMAVLALSAALGIPHAFGQDDFSRTQAIDIKKGWNAVYLEVDPTESNPSTLLDGTPIEIVATLFVRRSTSQFVSNPEANLLRAQGWTVWYQETRPDSFLSDLAIISGGRAYLINSKEDFVWDLEGESTIWSKFKWKTDAYNFVGFPVKKNAGPTFKQFFGSSPSHKESPVYRLKEGRWVRVEEKSAEALRSGEAFWIYCDGKSKFAGPLKVDVGSSTYGLIIGDGIGRIDLKNLADYPIACDLKHVLPPGGTQPIDFALRVLDGPGGPLTTEKLPLPNGNWTWKLPVLESGQAIAVPFSARTDEMLEDRYHSLFRLETDIGTLAWIRVTNYRE